MKITNTINDYFETMAKNNNKTQHMLNRNKTNLNLLHWNKGNKHFTHRYNIPVIESLLQNKHPDIFSISEANMNIQHDNMKLKKMTTTLKPQKWDKLQKYQDLQ